MNILIVEDETPAYTRLYKMIRQLKPEATISEQVSSIAEAEAWITGNPPPDLAFFDIQLSDGSALNLLENGHLRFPVVFTTAYSEYALKAFKTLSIDYLLKPVRLPELEKAFQSYQQMEQLFRDNTEKSPGQNSYKKRFIVRYADTIKTIATTEIAYFVSKNKGTLAVTADNRVYPIDYNLENLEVCLDPDIFFRINRQYIISIHALSDMKSYSKARVIVSLQPAADEQPVVSSERAAAFKKWLDGD